MPRLRQVRTKEEAAAVPEDQPIAVELSDEPLLAIKTEEKKDEKKSEVNGPLVKTAEPEPEDEGRETLKKRLEEVQNAEKLAREALESANKRIEEVNRQALLRDQEATKWQSDAELARYDAVTSGLAGWQSEADAAQRDLEVAINANDVRAQVDASARMAKAQGQIGRYEETKEQLDAEREERKKNPPRQQQRGDPLEAAIQHLPDLAKSWVRRHPDYMMPGEKNAALQHAHWIAKRESGEEYTQKYIDSLEVQLGLKQRATQDDDDEPEVRPARQERVSVSAPPTRESPSISTGKPTTTRVTLTPEQRAHAKASGVDELTYARGVQELERRKKEGHYEH